MRTILSAMLVCVAVPALAQSDCEKKWDALDATKTALTDCLRSGKSCKAEFEAKDRAVADAAPCGARPMAEDDAPAGGDALPVTPAAVIPTPVSVAVPIVTARSAAPASAAVLDPGQFRVGTGFGFSTGRALPLTTGTTLRVADGPLTIRVPMRGAKLRVEPELGFDRDGVKYELDGFSSTFIVTTVRVAVAVHWLSVEQGDSTLLYGGPRFGVDSVTISLVDHEPGFTSNDNSYRTDLFVAGVLGGEYYFSPRFSVGAEAQVVFTLLASAAETGSEDVSTSGNSASTQASLLFRWYY